MASWLPSPLSYFTFRSPAPPSIAGASSSPSDTPPAPATPAQSPNRARRLPAPPLRGSALADDSDAAAPSSGFKRERVNSAEQGVAVGQEDGNDGAEGSRAAKRRRGMLGSAVSTALDAAIFAGALSYSAYQLWKNPPTREALEAHLRQKRITDGREGGVPGALPLPLEAPPPYTEAPCPRPSSAPSPTPPVAPSPSQIPRRVRHIHEPRPRPSPRSSFNRPSPDLASSTSSSSSSLPPSNAASYDPFAALVPRGPLPEFQPYNSPKRGDSPRFSAAAFSPPGVDAQEDGDEEDEDDLEEDPEMSLVAARLKDLIETGREALVSRPSEWKVPHAAANASPSTATTAALSPPSRTRMSTGGSSASFGSSSSASASAFSSSLSRARSLGASAAPQNSLPTSLRPPSTASPAAGHGAVSPLSPPRSPRLSALSRDGAPATGHTRRRSVDPAFSPPASPASAFGSSASRGLTSPPPSRGASNDMRRAATLGHARRTSVPGFAAGAAARPAGREG